MGKKDERRKSRQDDYEDAGSTGISDEKTPYNMLQMTAELTPKFNGKDKTYPVSQWVSDVEDNAEIFGWSSLQQLLVARRSLTGTAALWLKAEKTFKTWEDLKTALCKEFPDTVDSKTIHELMSSRKKKSDESCIDYMFSMKELGKRGKMPDYVAIKYIIDGIPDAENNKIMLYGVTTYNELKERLKIYETIKTKMMKNKEITASATATTSKLKIIRNRRMIRCYSCGEIGHASSDCPSKDKGLKCFKCNEFGHVGSACPTKTVSETATIGNLRSPSANFGGNSSNKRSFITSTAAALEGATSDDMDSSFKMAEAQNCHGGEFNVLDVNKREKKDKHCGKPLKWVRFLCGFRLKCVGNSAIVDLRCGDNALIDSGSEINLVSNDFYDEIGSPQCSENNDITLTGLGFAAVRTQGSFISDIEIDNRRYCGVRFYIINRDSMPYKIILGHEFLRSVVTIMKDGCVWMKPHDSWINEIECFQCSVDSLGHILEEDVRRNVARLVDEYKPCQTKEAPIELKITLKDDIPVALRPRRVSPKEQQEIDEQMNEWLEEGIIRVSFSEYASPLVLVRKKDGKLRICVDYRLLNKKILKDEYPLPIIDDHVDKLAGARVFSALDLKNGFFHLKVHEDSIKYTSFVTMKSQFEFLKAPFGLSTCPKVFTRFISIIFRDLITRGIVIIFIDDLLIPAISEEQAVERLTEVLRTAAEYGLIINWKKSQLLVRRVEYLGYVIEDGKVQPSPAKTDAVMKFPEPKNEKQLHSFLGLCSYFRKFIENYALIARPLTEMLKKDTKFEFNKEHKIVFRILKEKLASKPVLKIYEPSAETELHTDASSVAYAAILMQKENNELHPIHYMSRKTSDAESRYTSYELEALAIIEGIKKFRHYLYGKHFKIVTDCKAFQMTLNKKDLATSTRVVRWILFLQDYDYEIEHRDGSRMRHADALSRHPYVATIFSDLHSDLRRAQECDDGLKAIMKILKEEKPFNDFCLHGGVLCKGPEQQVVVPPRMELEIIKRAHENGHFAKKKTMELIGKEYYISQLGKKVEDFISTCIPCLLASRKSGKQEGFLNPIEKGDIPLDTLHLDHIGPMTETRKQYNYILTVVDGFTKFVWLFPTKTTSAQEVLNKMSIHQGTFGNPRRIITDRGSAFTSHDFTNFCEEENIEHITITTGVPRGNGQVERIHRTLIAVLTKLSIEKPMQWYKLISRVQRAMNSTYQRSINTTPFELFLGTKMKRKEDLELYELLKQEERNGFIENRERLRINAKKQILDVQEENKRNFDKKRKPTNTYREGELVCIKRTQFGTGMKIKPKFLGPYRITKVKRNNRYDVEKADSQAEGPNKTTTSSDYMKAWPDYVNDEEK